MYTRIGVATLLGASLLLLSVGCSENKTEISTPDTSNLSVEPLQSPPGTSTTGRQGRSKLPDMASPGIAPN